MSQQTSTSKVNDISLKNESGISLERSERGVRIKALRTFQGLSQSDFAQQLGVTKQTQIAYESGARVPDADYLTELFFRFAVDLGPLITGAPRAQAGKTAKGGVRDADSGSAEMLFKYEALPPKLRKTVHDVLLLAWLAYQDRRAVHEEVDVPAAPAKRAAKKKL